MGENKPMTPDEMISVIRAFKEGKVIQYTNSEGYWVDCTATPVWNFNQSLYRVKPPEPVIEVRYGRIQLNGNSAGIVGHFGPHNASGHNNLELTFEDVRLIKARVV